MRRALVMLVAAVVAVIGPAGPAHASNHPVPVGPVNCWNVADIYWVDYPDGDEFVYKLHNRTGGYIQARLLIQDESDIGSSVIFHGWIGPYGDWNRSVDWNQPSEIVADYAKQRSRLEVRYYDTYYVCNFGWWPYQDGPY